MRENTADQPLDDIDAALLEEVAQLYEAVDPVPAGLIDGLSFGLALDELDAEVAAMTRIVPELAGVRGDSTDVRTETMTFAAESLTAMVTVGSVGTDRVRLDGWIAPMRRFQVRLRTQQGRLETPTDDRGRFCFPELPRGFVQLSFHCDPDADTDSGDPVVVTPSFEL